ncbi:MAG: thioredoxin-like domain-containing protein [Bacteroidota bacterium]
MKASFSYFLIAILFLTACASSEGETKEPTAAPATPAVKTASTSWGSSPGYTKPAEPLNISFSIKGVPDGQFLKMVGSIGTTNFIVDSVSSSQNPMVIQQDTSMVPGWYYLYLPNGNIIQFLLDQDQQFSLTTTYADPVGAMQVEGSQDNTLLYENLKWEQDFQQRYQAANGNVPAQESLVAERKAHIQSFADRHPNSFFTIFKLAGQNPTVRNPLKANGVLDTVKQVFHYRNEFWDNVDFADERLLHTPIVANKLKTYINDITPQRIDSVIKWADKLITKAKVNKEMFKFVVNQYAIKYHQSDIMGGEAIFVHLVDRYYTDQLAFWTAPKELRDIRDEANEMRPSLIGNIGQNLSCPNVNGQMESLYDMPGKIKILYMWSYNCDHCKERTPGMKRVYEQWKDKGLEVYALCVEPDAPEWKAFIQQYGIGDWHNVHDPTFQSKFYAKYHVDITPEIYVMDQNHRIIAKDLHPDQLPEILQRELM